MRELIRPAHMRLGEERYFSSGREQSIDVMERAANALAEEIASRVPAGARICFACGTGGNGGDGTACARMLAQRYACTVIQWKTPVTPDAKVNFDRAKQRGVEILPANALETLERPDIWVDCLFGTGLSRAIEGEAADIIRRINADHEAGTRVFAADIPSGLNGETGKQYDPCVYADLTVAFQYAKTGEILFDGLDVCGNLIVRDIGFPKEAFAPLDAEWIAPDDLSALLPQRKRNIHKGICGHLLIVAGSFGMAGAAAMCAKGALRSGCGLVTLACVRSIVPILQTLVPQAMCVPLPETDGAMNDEAAQIVRETMKGKNAVVIGCGLSRKASTKVIEAVLISGLPTVVDADALNLISLSSTLEGMLCANHVLTPHPGEAARLCPDVDLSDQVAAAREMSGRLGACVLLKGASCVVSDGTRTIVSTSGACGMARGGSGDILAGIMGALLAEKSARSFAETAAAASELHGLAGEKAQEKYGSRGMNAMDILEMLPEVLP